MSRYPSRQRGDRRSYVMVGLRASQRFASIVATG